MRTTLNIDAQVLAEFKRIAADTHRTLSAVIEDSLRHDLSRRQAADVEAPLPFPVYHGKGGLLPGVDLDSNAELFGYLDEVEGVNDKLRRGE